MKRIVILVFILFVQSNYAQIDSIAIYYDLGQYKLTKTNIVKIQNQLKVLEDASNYYIQIISSCDYIGSSKSNELLSVKRAEAVRDLLLKRENIIVSAIKYQAVGEIPVNKKEKRKNGIKNHRKTTLIIKTESQFKMDKIKHSKKGDIIAIDAIVFYPGRHFLRKKSIPILKELLEVLQKNPKLKIEIRGHVCCGKSITSKLDGLDNDTKTYDLSKNRAKHIYNYLVYKKIDSTRIIYHGYGFTKPLVFPEITNQDRMDNRRVEIKVISN